MRFCAHPHCPVLVRKGYCAIHERADWRTREPTPPRTRGRKLQFLRNELFKQQPLCVLCQEQGRVRVATIRDHIRPLAEGGLDTEANVQAVCQQCSDIKTQQESLRGRMRVR